MKINFIVPEISRTGGMRIIFEYANRLTSRGYNVVLYSPNIPFNNYMGMFMPYYIKYRFKYGLKNIITGNKLAENIFERSFDVKFLWMFNDHTIRDADVTVATSWTTSYVVDKLNESKGKKYYLIQDYEQWNSNVEYVDKSYSLNLNRITVSGYLKNLLLDRFNSDSEVILNSIDFSVFNNPGKKFGTKTQILFMDHSLENKNTVDAIETVKNLKFKYPDLNIKCFGFKNYHKLPDFVNFTENPDDIETKRLYCESDIFLYTSKFEGFGLPPAEAMACKCAVVGNNVGAVPEFSQNMKSAILTSPEFPHELIKGAEYLLNNKEELKRISLEGCKSVKEKLNWDNSVDKFIKLIS